MKKTAAGIIVLILALAGGFAFKNRGGPVRENGGPAVRIGVVLPLSGDMSRLGKEAEQGLIFAVKERHPRTKAEFIVEDDQGKSNRTALAAHKLINRDKVDVILSYSSQSASVIAPIAANAGALQFATASDDEFTKIKGNYAFRPSVTDDAELLLSHIQKQGHKKAAVISQIDAYFLAVEQEMKDRASAYGITVVFDAQVVPTDRDFRMLTAKAEREKPEIYVINAWPPAVNILLRQLREKRTDVPATSAYAFAMVDDPRLVEGQSFVNFGYEDNGFNDKFRREFGVNPSTVSANFYGLTDFLLQVFDGAGGWRNPALLRERMERAVAEGDNLLDLSLRGNRIAFRNIVVRIADGKEEKVRD